MGSGVVVLSQAQQLSNPVFMPTSHCYRSG